MKRPGSAGLLILLAFAIVFAVEFHTILGMIGIEIAATLYFPIAALIIFVVFAGLFMLPEQASRNPNTTSVHNN